MRSQFKRILVTGGAGYVGTSLVELLLGSGLEVRVLDALRFGGNGLLPFMRDSKLEFVKGDIRDGDIVRSVIDGVDAVIHLAAIVGYPACRKDPSLSRDINVNGTAAILAAVRDRLPIIFASTGSTYGKMIEEYCTETTRLNPLSDYGRQKAEAEEIVQQNKEFVIYRFATGFGVSHRMRWDLLPNDFTYRAVREKTLIVYEKDFLRTFIHVRDMARALHFALENYDKMRGEIYNVGSNDLNFRKEDIALMLKRKVDFFLHFVDIGHDVDQRNYAISYDKIADMGFRPAVSMQDGLDELIRASQLIEIYNPYTNG